MSTTPRDPRPVRSAATGAAAAAAPVGAPPLLDRAGRYVRRQAWVTGAWVLLALLLLLGVATHPTGFSSFDVQTLVLGSMPLAFAAMAQAVVVISGGIDLSVGAAMSVFNVASARLFENASFPQAVGLSFALIACGALVGACNGLLVVLTRVPDIVVTLAMSFVWAGSALLVLNRPGGGSSTWLKEIIKGSLGNEWIPKAAIVLIVVIAVIWIPLRRSKSGLRIYAVGSDRLAAFRSGVSVGRTKVLAYALLGLFAALGGLALTASTGIGTPVPGPYTLLSVAAVVLGGVSLAGGRGGIVGPLIAVAILQLIRTDMTFLRFDPNLAVVVQGVILIGVVMVGSLVQLRRQRG
jgi:ribose transport system permease protein